MRYFCFRILASKTCSEVQWKILIARKCSNTQLRVGRTNIPLPPVWNAPSCQPPPSGPDQTCYRGRWAWGGGIFRLPDLPPYFKDQKGFLWEREVGGGGHRSSCGRMGIIISEPFGPLALQKVQSKVYHCTYGGIQNGQPVTAGLDAFVRMATRPTSTPLTCSPPGGFYDS